MPGTAYVLSFYRTPDYHFCQPLNLVPNHFNTFFPEIPYYRSILLGLTGTSLRRATLARGSQKHYVLVINDYLSNSITDLFWLTFSFLIS
jgi:hypothetical protein